MVTRRAVDEAEDVVFLLVDELIGRVHAVPIDEQPSFVRGLNPGLRMLWGTFMVDGEVNNGGFNQFFWNSSREYVREAGDGYRLIGAFDHARLLDEAVDRFEAHASRLAPYRDRETVEAFTESYAEDTFADLDQRFYELDSAPLILAYLRSNLEEFTTG